MVKPVFGGPGPSTKLYHYGAAIMGAARKYSFWTDADLTDKETISRLTGVPVMSFKFKNMVMVNDRRLDEFFSNEATIHKPGLTGYFEFKNKVEIPESYIEKTPLP